MRVRLTPKRLAAALGVAIASMLLGSLVATHTVSAINPFYRSAVPPGWREPAARPPEPTEPPLAFTPIGWGPAPVAEPPRPDLPPAPDLNGYDDAPLLAGIDDAPPPLPDYAPEPRPEPAPEPPAQVDAPPPAAAIPAGPEPATPTATEAPGLPTY